MAMFKEEAFALLAELDANNNKAWYEVNKDRLKAVVRTPFGDMLGLVSKLLEGSSAPMIGSDKTMFRQYRDVRFSKDKTPYKSTVSGMLTPSGTKESMSGVVYAQIDPKGGWIAAGFYKLETAELNRFRQQIVDAPDQFREIREGLEAKGYPLNMEGGLKRMPRGFAEHEDHEHADALRLKRFVVSGPTDKDVWLNGDIVEKLVHLAEAMAPLHRFGRNALTKLS